MSVAKYIVRDLVDREEIECTDLETAENVAIEVEEKLIEYAIDNGNEWEHGSRVEILERVKVRDRVYDEHEDVEKMETIYRRNKEEKQELLEAAKEILEVETSLGGEIAIDKLEKAIQKAGGDNDE